MIEPQEFRHATGSFATGVAVVTTEVDGRRHGLTANSFTSVSLDPPLVLFCLARNAGSLDAFAACSSFAINILGRDQEDVSRRFATPSPDKFDGVEVRRGQTGSPLLERCHAVLECRPEQIHEAGDHVIVLGRVEAIEVHDGDPLVFHRSRYWSA